jgi:tRNA(Arg) A34 adenosine deaminase TadA
MPQWVSEHFEVIESLRRERELTEVNARFPGLDAAFDDLLVRQECSYSSLTKEFPIRASVLRLDPQIGKLEALASSGNNTNGGKNSTLHAESIVINRALDRVQDKHLFGCVLLTTVQPCIACVGDIENTRISTVFYGAPHNDLEGKHAYVNGVYKPWRTSNKGFSSLQQRFDQDDYMRNVGIEVVGGYRRDEVLRSLARGHGSWSSHFSDLDSRYV